MTEKKEYRKNLVSELIIWWSMLKDHKGDRAALRRCYESPDIISHTKHLVLLSKKLNDSVLTDFEVNKIMPIFGLLSHVKLDDKNKKIAIAMAQPKNNNAIVSEVRFQRILQSKNQSELYPLLLRGIKMLDYKISVYDLITSIYYWGDKKKKEWALDYYRNATIK